MTIKQELITYAKRCISGKIISCTKHKWACQRFLDDLKRAGQKDCPFVWNEKEAQKIVTWFSYLRHSKGVLAGKPIDLITAQKFDLCQIYGWQKRGTNLRRFNKSYTQKARKNAKSQEQAGVALYEMSCIAAKNHEVNECYCAGTKSEQSKKVFDEARLMLRKIPRKSDKGNTAKSPLPDSSGQTSSNSQTVNCSDQVFRSEQLAVPPRNSRCFSRQRYLAMWEWSVFFL